MDNALQQFDSSEDEDQTIFFTKINSNREVKNQLLKNSFKSLLFNFKYNLIHSSYFSLLSFQRKPIHIQNNQSFAYLMGQSYDCSTMEKFKKHFQSIIWFSYRTESEGLSDVGWGCMIRVVQMIFAQIFRRHNKQLPVEDIIAPFKSGKENLFSLESICQEGDLFQRWTSFNEVVSVFTSILKSSIKNKQASMKYQMQFGIHTQIHHSYLDVCVSSESEEQFPKVILISSHMLPKNEHQLSQYYPHLQHLMKFKQFCGAAGGIGQQALFIVGSYEDKVIAMDPHYAQYQSEEKVKYFKNTPRGIPLRKLAPTYSLCYYFESIEEYKGWIGDMIYIQRVYQPYTIFEVKTEDDEQNQKNRKRSADFQIL